MLLEILYIYLAGFVIVWNINMFILLSDREEVFHWSFMERNRRIEIVLASVMASAKFAAIWFYIVPMFILKKILLWHLMRRMRKNLQRALNEQE